MRTNSPNKLHPKSKTSRKSGLFQKRKDLQDGQSYQAVPHFQLTILLDRFLLGISKIWVALKYHFHRLTAGAFAEMRMPWLKLGVAALAIFVLTQKDIQFSINMKAPAMAGVDGEEEARNTSRNTDQMNMAQTVNFRSSSSPAMAVSQLDDDEVRAYIKRFRKVAQVEMAKFGIPASIKMAQGILESNAGTSAAAQQSNNHFGTPLSGQYYESAWENWRSHSALLKQEFPALFQQGLNYEKWAKGIQKTGYSTDKKYGKKLVDVIERYQLYLIDDDEL
ncbi:MAG: glucosaminidase domain-containing protein [Bacteroidota bacterium]